MGCLILFVILVYLKTNISGLEEDVKNGKKMTYDQLAIVHQRVIDYNYSTVPGTA